jgi:predicted metalloprotease
VHELGHHTCGHVDQHIAGARTHIHTRELQADQFAGWAMKKVGDIALQPLMTKLKGLWGAPSAEHPPVEDRLLAVARGWNRGRPAAC